MLLFKVVRVKPQAIHGKKDTTYAQALDSQQNNIQVKDTVKVVDGPYAVGFFSASQFPSLLM